MGFEPMTYRLRIGIEPTQGDKPGILAPARPFRLPNESAMRHFRWGAGARHGPTSYLR